MIYSKYRIVDFKEGKPIFFEGRYPKAAALKAFVHLLKFIDISDFKDKFIVFSIELMGQNDLPIKKYKYIGTRIKLHRPIIKQVNGEKVKYEYKDVIGKYNPDLEKINIKK